MQRWAAGCQGSRDPAALKHTSLRQATGRTRPGWPPGAQAESLHLVLQASLPRPRAKADVQRQGQLGHQCPGLLSFSKAAAPPSHTASSAAQDLVQQVIVVHLPMLQLVHLCTRDAGASLSVQQAPRKASQHLDDLLPQLTSDSPVQRQAVECTSASTWLRTFSACVGRVLRLGVPQVAGHTPQGDRGVGPHETPVVQLCPSHMQTCTTLPSTESSPAPGWLPGAAGGTGAPPRTSPGSPG